LAVPVNDVLRTAPGDDELLALVLARDGAAFETLYNRYGDLVYSVAMRVLADPAAAQDVAQDVFIRLWRNPASFDPERGRFMPWLLSVTRNRSVDEVRARSRRRLRELPVLEGAEDPVDLNAPDPALMAVAASEQRVIRVALGQLPAEQREVIDLAYFAGLTQPEIAERLATPLGTVKTRIRLGMKKLRVALGVESESTSLL
jgi:RNA polymerase sigma-70 factor, ECF subfamily